MNVAQIGLARESRRPNMNTPETFWARVDKKPESCWVWEGYLDTHGYGLLQYQGRKILAHRLAFELRLGPIPAGKNVCHSCDNPPCCNPSHLWLGTTAENIRDSAAKGRMHRGAAHGMARLSEADVRTIRDLLNQRVPGTTIARRFGVSPNTVYSIAARRSWAWM